MTSDSFLTRFEEFLARNGWPPGVGPWGVVEQWETLVGQVLEGYQWGFYEFGNELGVRDLLEGALNDRALREFEQTVKMADRVRHADDLLRSAFLPDLVLAQESDPWWRRGVLANAGDEYSEDVRRLFGID